MSKIYADTEQGVRDLLVECEQPDGKQCAIFADPQIAGTWAVVYVQDIGDSDALHLLASGMGTADAELEEVQFTSKQCADFAQRLSLRL